MRVAVSLLALAMMLAACGYKGPLYMPKPKPEAQQPALDPKQQQKSGSGQ